MKNVGDSASGLDYAWNRYYSTTWGRFGSADPYVMSGGMTTPQGWNRYSYVNGDPVNFYDPQGLQAARPIFDWECWESASSMYGYTCAMRVKMFWDGGVTSGGGSGGPAPPEPDRRVGPPSGAQFNGFNEAYDALLAKTDCAGLIGGKSGLTAAKLQTALWNADVTAGTTQPGNGTVSVTSTPDGRYEYSYQTAYTTGGNIELNGNYFPDPTQPSIALPGGKTTSLLQLVNNTLGSNLNATEFGAFVFLHELSHIAGNSSASIDTDDYNKSVISKCIK